MTENDTVCSLHEKEATAIVCIHLCLVENEPIGFNVPGDIKTDTDAWCDECEKIIGKEGWTDRAIKFADLRPACIGCFIAIKNRMGF